MTSILVMAVLPSVRIKDRESHWTDLAEIFYLKFLLKFVEASSTFHISCAQIYIYHRTTNLCT